MTEHSLNLNALANALADGGHSIFAPSSSAMFMGCSGSLLPNLLAKDTAGEDAAIGTVAHSVHELWLRSRKKPRHLLGDVVKIKEGDRTFEVEITEEMMEYVQMSVDRCILIDGQHFVEQRVYFSEFTPLPKQGGTADHVVCSWQHMTITDLKFGKGVRVFAEGNTQAQMYALGFFLEWDWLYYFQTITIRIHQPRLDHFDEWTITRSDLLAFADLLRERTHAAWQHDAPRRASEKACQWCKVKATCGAYAYLMTEMTAGIFDDLDRDITADDVQVLRDDMHDAALGEFKMAFVPTMELTTEELSKLYVFRKTAEAWWAAIEKELFKRAQLPDGVPNYKLVEARSNRQFRDEAKAKKFLLEMGLKLKDIITEKMISPAQAETLLVNKKLATKAIAAEKLSAVAYKPPGKPTLAAAHDKRAPIEGMTDRLFDDLDETETTETEDL